MLITADNGITADSMFSTDPAPVGGSGYVRAEGFQLYNTGTSTFTNGAFHAQKLYDASWFSNIVCANYNGISAYIHSVSYGSSFYNFETNCNGTGSTSLLIGVSGAGTSRLNFFGGGFTHAADADRVIKITGGLYTTNIGFFGCYVEANTGSTSVAPILVDTNVCDVLFSAVRVGHSNNQFGAEVSAGATANFVSFSCDSGKLVDDNVNSVDIQNVADAPYSSLAFYTTTGGTTKGRQYAAGRIITPGSAVTYDNELASPGNTVRVTAGTDVANGTAIFALANNNGGMADKWRFTKDTSNNLHINDVANSLNRISVNTANTTVISAAAGANAVRVNAANSSGTGGLEVWNGAASAAKVASISGTGVLNVPSLPPASAAAAGTAGDVAWDAGYIYICTATNTWKRVAIATW
jgi:hypothetical protein